MSQEHKAPIEILEAGTEIVKEFTFSTGKKVIIHPVSPIFMQNATKAIMNKWIEENGEFPEVPTYEAVVGEGESAETIVYKYDQESIVDGTPEEQQAYEDYIQTMSDYSDHESIRTAEILMRRGIELEYPKGWEDDYKAIGMEIPEDPYEKKIYFIENECIGTPSDYADLIQAIMSMTGVDMGLVEEALDGFRDNISRNSDNQTEPELEEQD